MPLYTNISMVNNNNNNINDSLQPLLQNINNFEESHYIIYCAALVASIENGIKINETKITKNGIENPPWERRLENKIQNLRSNIKRLTQYKMGDL